MIVLDCKQQSKDWHRARLGILTSTHFSKIITTTGKLSASRDEHMARLLAEWALGEDYELHVDTYWTDRGVELEPKARAAYCFERDVSVKEVGLCYRDDSKMVAASPDALSGDDGLLEIKCLSPHRHLMALSMSGVPREHRMQLQAQMWVCGRNWVDWMAWNPDLSSVIHRVEPDDALFDGFDKHIPTFIAEMLERRDVLTSKHGIEPIEYDEWGGL